MLRALLVLCFLYTAMMQAQQSHPLYPGKVPNSRAVPNPESVEHRASGGRAISNVAIPELTAYRPEHPNGQAVIICPGGGYARLAYDKEGVWIAKQLVKDSITAFVLKYRIPQDATNVNKSLAPLMDAQQAIRTVRKQATDHGVDPNRIGIMGFSAGGHLAATAATQFARPADPNETDTTSVRPDFVALIYPVISFDSTITHAGSRRNLIGDAPPASRVTRFSAEEQVTPLTPPAFLVHAADDRAVPVQNSLRFYESCLRHGVAAEMHLYAAGGHGFGLRNPTTPDRWLERFTNWLRTL
ncbi:acetyl esterase/lipase [Lewinella marina]|uniref:Alpha/beta hydrolase n=1 Tax=Neolewinella marina TaxID=438751 RepID=A0A2G0CIQ7_9BACT|nr:alpha/beta hydrolase [Neolewinella marina]NJB84986.1 acetyl esterase/lipase [Neolewinella marina]PHK99864.1 alpha/beta hydrolase [Neolewinella marina]